ncbi:class III lanthionine synthetase LanKC [Kitasatospora sp. NPDC101157]|uniref:class III lanthionine synthetase LanKC n=1 Tax=Kitasatospora sp. NPDC101157 TaxID=3364098 RepID=UPI00380D496D
MIARVFGESEAKAGIPPGMHRIQFLLNTVVTWRVGREGWFLAEPNAGEAPIVRNFRRKPEWYSRNSKMGGGGVDAKYESYAIADPVWYDALDRCDDRDSRFAPGGSSLPKGWCSRTQGVWEVLTPPGGSALPAQGWKVHISATPDSAGETIETAWRVCRRLGLPWKYLRSRLVVAVVNAKYADRSASGKAVTVYPRTVEELGTVLAELEAELAGRPGPYVLSDLRWNQGPVSVRYGGFALMWCELPDGSRVPAVKDPEGRLVPDARRPRFTVPEWAEIPDFLGELIAAAGARTGATLGGYRVVRALHFSNAGGVYLAEDEDGRPVVIKEARPHAGLDASGTDAVARLLVERDVLEKVGRLPFAPTLIEYFTAWEHHYLAMEYIPGETFSAWLGREYPLTRHRPDARVRAGFAGLAVARLAQVEECVAALHREGVAFGDLHHRNIMIRPDGTIALIDFELATALDTPRRATLGAPGFMDGAIVDAREADLFALGCCQLAALVSLTALTRRNPAVVSRLLDLAREDFPTLPNGFTERMIERLALSPALRPYLVGRSIDEVRSRTGTPSALNAATLLRGIDRAATPGREDRLHPGDVAGLRPGGALGLAYGSAGVLLARHLAGAAVDEAQLGWLAAAARRAPIDTPVGLYEGLAGTCWLFHQLGHPDAPSLVDRLLTGPLPESPGLYGGLTGVAHLLLEVGATDEALGLAAKAAGRIGEAGLLDRPGLLRGWSGPAVLFARCARFTGDAAWAEAAESAVRCDLRHGRMVGDMLQTHSSGRLLPYLAEGSGGVALAALALPAVQAEALGVDRLLEAVARAGAVRVVVQGGLFNGRAGLAYVLSCIARRVPGWQAEVTEQLRLLEMHLAPYEDGHVLHGDQLVRLSTDLATGSAGALLALEAAKSPGRHLLPGAHPSSGWMPERAGPGTGTRRDGGRR